MKLKELSEKRVALISKMESILETRDADATARFDELKSEVERIDSEIRELSLEKAKNKNVEEMKGNDDTMEIREMLLEGKEVELRSNETTKANALGAEQKDAVYGVVKKAEHISPLFKMADKLVTSATTAITVQGTKLDKFVPMNELANFANKQVGMETKTLNAHKYGIMATISEELVNDAAYDVEGEISEQIVEAFAKTMDELIVKGDTNCFGLEKAEDSAGAHKTENVNLTEGEAIDNLLKVYYALPAGYRKDAVWVISPEHEMQLAALKDGNGQPLLTPSYAGTPQAVLLGRPVIVNPYATRITFCDLAKALKVGVRTGLTIKRDDSIGFANDTIAFKGVARVDIVDMVQDAISYGVAGMAVKAKTK